LTVKVTGLLVPPEVTTVTFLAPGDALAAMVRVALICALPDAVTPLAVTPAPDTLTLRPEARNPLPVIVTGTVAPCKPLAGLIFVMVGTAGSTVKDTVLLLVPSSGRTLTS
jgi:hypothetical protein